MSGRTSLSKDFKIGEQRNKFELFLKNNGVAKSFGQYADAIEWKMCRDKYKTKNITSYTNLFACTDPKEFDELMPKLLNNPLFLQHKNDPSTGSFSDHINAMKRYSAFLHSQAPKFMSNFSPKLDTFNDDIEDQEEVQGSATPTP